MHSRGFTGKPARSRFDTQSSWGTIPRVPRSIASIRDGLGEEPARVEIRTPQCTDSTLIGSGSLTISNQILETKQKADLDYLFLMVMEVILLAILYFIAF